MTFAVQHSIAGRALLASMLAGACTRDNPAFDAAASISGAGTSTGTGDGSTQTSIGVTGTGGTGATSTGGTDATGTQDSTSQDSTSHGSTQGEVLPTPEDCENQLDENCDGATNEGC